MHFWRCLVATIMVSRGFMWSRTCFDWLMLHKSTYKIAYVLLRSWAQNLIWLLKSGVMGRTSFWL